MGIRQIIKQVLTEEKVDDVQKLLDTVRSCKTISQFNSALKMWNNYEKKHDKSEPEYEKIKVEFNKKRKELQSV